MPAQADNQPGKLAGLPRLFFAELEHDELKHDELEHDELEHDEQALDQPNGQRAPAPDGPFEGQPGQYGWPARQAGPPQRGQQPGQRPTTQRSARGASGSGQARASRPPGRELRQRAIASLVFGVMSLVAILYGFGPDPKRGVYLVSFSSLVGLAAIVIGVSAIVKARKTGSYRPRGAVGGIGLGALATLVSLAFLVLYLGFPSQMRTYVNCVNQSQSASQRQACLNQLEKSIQHGVNHSQGNADGPRRRTAESSWLDVQLSR